ncbi:MAG: hypothetical protein ACFFBD_27125, partial [Candidatus Hodarchaeota archaeon]
IYFSKDLKKRLTSKFHELLLPGGVFILGQTEIIPQSSRDLFLLISPREHIYQKSGTPEAQLRIASHTCRLCRASFYSQSDLEAHMEGHERENKYPRCDLCGKLLRDELRLKVHKRFTHKIDI